MHEIQTVSDPLWGLTLFHTPHKGGRGRRIMAENQYENVKLMTNAKGEGMTRVSVPIQSGADDFTCEYRSPRITIVRNFTVTGNGKTSYRAVSNNGENKVNSDHTWNNYKQMAQEIVNDEVKGWRTTFHCNPEHEAEVVQICYAVQRMASDLRAPRDMERYGQHADGTRATHYEANRAKYYNAWVAWKEAGYPVEVTVRDADGMDCIIEQYTWTIADATDLTVETEEEVVVVERKNFDCPHCGRRYNSYAGRYNHLRKNQCPALQNQE